MAEANAHGDTYIKLREFLDKLPAGFPVTEDGKEIEFLEWLYTPEEAEVEINMRGAPEPVPVIAKRCGKPEEETRRILEALVKKGLVFPLYKGGKPLYMATHYIIGFVENVMSHGMDPASARLMEDAAVKSDYLAFFARQKQMRIVPVGDAVEVTPGVALYDRIREMVRKQKTITVTPCACRTMRGHLDQKCEHEVEIELTFGVMARYRMDHGFGREIGVDEALKIIDRAEEAGLVLSPVNSQEMVGLCFCGSCCCYWLQGLRTHERPADHVQSSYQAIIDPGLCDGCGSCIERCHMDAVIEGEDVMEVDLARCIGCGLCLSKCAREAISLVPKPSVQEPPLTFLGLYAKVARDRGLPLGKMLPLMNRISLLTLEKQWPRLQRLHLGEPILNQLAKRGMI
jgi:electron transport complex protein RnfB